LTRTDLLKTSLRLNVVDFIRAMTLNSCKTVPSHRAKVTQQFLQQNTPDFMAADEWASRAPDLSLLDYCIWISCRIWCTKADDFRLQIHGTSKRQSKTN